MLEANSPTPDLDQLRELNRLFLTYLRAHGHKFEFSLGFPEHAVQSLRAASDETLERAAELPQALFRIELGKPAMSDRWLPGETPAARALQSLQLTILLTVWSVSRLSPYRARALFGLTSRTLQQLRSFALSELPDLAATSRLVACNFVDADWLWCELFEARDPANRRYLGLVALQPSGSLSAAPRH